MGVVGVRQLKAQTSEILRRVEEGEEILVTRRGRACAKLIPAGPAPSREAGRPTLYGIFPDLPDATWEDFQELKEELNRIWEPKPPRDE